MDLLKAAMLEIGETEHFKLQADNQNVSQVLPIRQTEN